MDWESYKPKEQGCTLWFGHAPRAGCDRNPGANTVEEEETSEGPLEQEPSYESGSLAGEETRGTG